jgi:hypothetical protein
MVNPLSSFAFKLKLRRYSAAKSSEVTLSSTLFHHIAATYDGVQVKVYFDGVEAGAYTRPRVGST